jgi:hypothetical protein
MKISAWHKAQGDDVEWCFPLAHYDIVYQSKVFDETYSPDIDWIPMAHEIYKGGTGYYRKPKRKDYYEIYYNGAWENVGKSTAAIRWTEHIATHYRYVLPDEIEHSYCDYSLYPILTKDTAYGFLTRGCPRACGFCGVAEKEGRISHKVADLSEFWNGQKNIILLDPNILACREHPDLLRQLIDSKACVDFTQGLDIRLTNEENIALINEIKVKQIHFAWDNAKDDLKPYFERYKALAKHKPHGSFGTVYCLTNFGSTMEENLYRIYTLRDLGYDPYVMVYDKPNAPKEIRDLQRWVNNIYIFKSCEKFEDYRKGRN